MRDLHWRSLDLQRSLHEADAFCRRRSQALGSRSMTRVAAPDPIVLAFYHRAPPLLTSRELDLSVPRRARDTQVTTTRSS